MTSRVLLRSAFVKIKPTLPELRQIEANESTVNSHAFNVRKQTIIFGEVGDKALDGSSDLSQTYQNPTTLSPTLAIYHSILPHEYDPLNLSFASQAFTNLMHLLRADIVDGDDEDTLVSTRI